MLIKSSEIFKILIFGSMYIIFVFKETEELNLILHTLLYNTICKTETFS